MTVAVEQGAQTRERDQLSLSFENLVAYCALARVMGGPTIPNVATYDQLSYPVEELPLLPGGTVDELEFAVENPDGLNDDPHPSTFSYSISFIGREEGTRKQRLRVSLLPSGLDVNPDASEEEEFLFASTSGEVILPASHRHVRKWLKGVGRAVLPIMWDTPEEIPEDLIF
jgi:hypothetical protein